MRFLTFIKLINQVRLGTNLQTKIEILNLKRA
jgi:hypothetical protein